MMTDDQKDEYAQRVNTEKLEAERATQPSAPAPTPRTDAALVLCNYGEYRVPADFARKLERELTAAKQPVPDAGVREKVNNVLTGHFKSKLTSALDTLLSDGDLGAGDPPAGYEELEGKALRIADECFHHGKEVMRTAILNWAYDALPAPTPATSEDTLMLDWLEKNGETLINGGTRYGSYVYPDYFKENKRVGYFVKDTLRQALRAAMAHAGAQKT